MRIVVIGGSGHVGSFLVPRLVRAGHQVVNLSRGKSQPYVVDETWLTSSRSHRPGRRGGRRDVRRPGRRAGCRSRDRHGRLHTRLGRGAGRGNPRPYRAPAALRLDLEVRAEPQDAGARRTNRRRSASTGSQKAAIAELLPPRRNPAGWSPRRPSRPHQRTRVAADRPAGQSRPRRLDAVSAGTEIAVPGIGGELLHHVHADDVAQAFQLAVEHRDEAAGESFNVVAPSAMTVRGFAEIVAGWFGQAARPDPSAGRSSAPAPPRSSPTRAGSTCHEACTPRSTKRGACSASPRRTSPRLRCSTPSDG